MSAVAAEDAAAFLLERVRAARGRLWDEGPRRGACDPSPPAGGALAVFARRRVRGVSPVVAGALLAWARGERPADLSFEVLSARAILRHQAAGRRCVALVDDAAARAHGDPRHPDGLSFALHDLCHLEKSSLPSTTAARSASFARWRARWKTRRSWRSTPPWTRPGPPIATTSSPT